MAIGDAVGQAPGAPQHGPDRQPAAGGPWPGPRTARRAPGPAWLVPAKAPEAWEPEEWILEPDLAAEAAEAVERGRKPGRRGTVPVPEAEIEADVRAELARAVGATKVAKFEVRLRDATRAFEAERFSDAARMLKKLADDAPSAAAARGLTGSRCIQGKWRQARMSSRRSTCSPTPPSSTPCWPTATGRCTTTARWPSCGPELKAASPEPSS